MAPMSVADSSGVVSGTANHFLFVFHSPNEDIKAPMNCTRSTPRFMITLNSRTLKHKYEKSKECEARYSPGLSARRRGKAGP
jgi:hypothetical protein